MIINKPKQESRTATFYELPIGTGFHWENWYYIKIEECYKCPEGGGMVRRGNAIQLENGLLAHFTRDTLVEKVPMSIEVLE